MEYMQVNRANGAPPTSCAPLLTRGVMKHAHGSCLPSSVTRAAGAATIEEGVPGWQRS
ncbi:MAG: hypothetical protein ACLS3M_10085 [Collinsella sp.]